MRRAAVTPLGLKSILSDHHSILLDFGITGGVNRR